MKLSNRSKSVLATAGFPTNEKSAIAQLAAFASQNSGINPRDYYDPYDLKSGRREAYYQGLRALKQEQRSISEDWRRFKVALITAGAEGVNDAAVIAAAGNGRLTWKNAIIDKPELGGHWDYTTGQYFATEYRKAAANVLEQAIRDVRQARPAVAGTITTISELKDLNAKNGGCWFDRSSMKFFGTRIESGIIRGKYFVTSEQPPHGSRKYSVRSFDSTGDVWTVGEFCSHLSKADAVAAIKSL